MDRPALDARMPADRHLASAAKGREQRAFGGHGRSSRRIVQLRHQLLSFAAVIARLNRERALPDGGTHYFHANQFANAVRPSQPALTRGGEHDRVVLALVELTQARIDIPAQSFCDESPAQRVELRRAAERASADFGALLELREGPADQSVARIFALGNRRKSEAVG